VADGFAALRPVRETRIISLVARLGLRDIDRCLLLDRSGP
jgi:hypothetical protein